MLLPLCNMTSMVDVSILYSDLWRSLDTDARSRQLIPHKLDRYWSSHLGLRRRWSSSMVRLVVRRLLRRRRGMSLVVVDWLSLGYKLDPLENLALPMDASSALWLKVWYIAFNSRRPSLRRKAM